MIKKHILEGTSESFHFRFPTVYSSPSCPFSSLISKIPLLQRWSFMLIPMARYPCDSSVPLLCWTARTLWVALTWAISSSAISMRSISLEIKMMINLIFWPLTHSLLAIYCTCIRPSMLPRPSRRCRPLMRLTLMMLVLWLYSIDVFMNLLLLTSFPLPKYKIYRYQQYLYAFYRHLIDLVNILNHSLPIFTIQSDYEMNTKNGAYQPNNLQSPSLNALSDLDMNNFYCMNNNLPQYIFQLQLCSIPLTRILFLDPLTIAIEFVSSPPFLNS